MSDGHTKFVKAYRYCSPETISFCGPPYDILVDDKQVLCRCAYHEVVQLQGSSNGRLMNLFYFTKKYVSRNSLIKTIGHNLLCICINITCLCYHLSL